MPTRGREATRRAMGSALLLAVPLITLIVSTRSLAGVPERVGLSVLSFFQRGFSSVSSFASDTVNSVATLRELQARHKELLARVEALSIVERSYSEIKRENDRLKEQLGYLTESRFRSISARIIARDPENVYSTIVVDKGIAHGIVKNQAVIAFQDGVEGLVGRVVEVSRASCLVSPIYDSGAYAAVRLERSRYEGLAVGSGSADEPMLVKYVKKRAKDEIQYGDLVVTSGLKSLYPAGISVGRVKGVRDLEYLTSLELDVEPVIDFGRLEYVFVLQETPDEGEAGR